MTTFQRNVFVVFSLLMVLAALVTLIVGFHNDAHVSYNAKRTVEWLQPAELDAQYQTPIGNKIWLQQYHEIEEILWRSTENSQHELRINSDTLGLLKQASALMPMELSKKELQRLGYVISKSWPGSKGQELTKLLIDYTAYERQHKADIVSLNTAKPEVKKTLLMASQKKREQLQIRIFGKEKAEKLFSKQNTTFNYLNERSIINITEGLSFEQKKERLLLLKTFYQDKLNE